MSDESSDEDYCPTKAEESEFDKVKKDQTLIQKIEKKECMSTEASNAAEELLKSFKVKQPYMTSKTKNLTQINPGQSGQVNKKPQKLKIWEFAGEVVKPEETVKETNKTQRLIFDMFIGKRFLIAKIFLSKSNPENYIFWFT
jgi:hypothetical protein